MLMLYLLCIENIILEMHGHFLDLKNAHIGLSAAVSSNGAISVWAPKNKFLFFELFLSRYLAITCNRNDF